MREHAVRNLQLAASVMAWEAQRGDGVDVAPAIEKAFCRLHEVMATLVGSGGYSAFFVRAVDLAKHDHPWLDALVVSKPAFAIHQVADQVEAVGAEPALRGATVLFATLLDLFCAFIGEDLTWIKVHQAWPEVPAAGTRTTPPREST